MSKSTEKQLLVDKIVEAIQDTKGEDIQIFDLSGIENSVADTFVICSGNTYLIADYSYRVSKVFVRNHFPFITILAAAFGLIKGKNGGCFVFINEVYDFVLSGNTIFEIE